MDNKTLAEFVRTEVGKVISAINRLALQISQPRKNDQTSNEQDQRANQADTWTKAPVPVISPSPKNPPQPKHTTDKPKPRRTLKRKIWRQFKRIFLKKDRLEKIGLIAGIVYAGVTVLQWRDLRHNFIADQRPFIFFGLMADHPKFAPLPTASGISSEPTIATKVTYSNVGKTPAIRVRLLGSVFHGPTALQLADNWFASLSKSEIIQQERESSPATFMVAQGQPPANSIITGRHSISDKANLFQTQIVTAVRAEYFDTAGNLYWTDFCHWQMPNMADQMHCPSHNDIH